MRDTIDMAREANLPACHLTHEKALKRFEALVRADERNRTWTQEHWTEYERSIAAAEREACAVCNEVHTILDADESKIIRDAKDGYPDGRTPRTLTLQERVTALCVYASDWKRWCLEKENTNSPAAQRPVAEPHKWVGLSEEEIDKLKHTLDWTATWSPGRFAYEIEQLLKEKNT